MNEKVIDNCLDCGDEILVNIKGKKKRRCDPCAEKRNIQLTMKRKREQSSERKMKNKFEIGDEVYLIEYECVHEEYELVRYTILGIGFTDKGWRYKIGENIRCYEEHLFGNYLTAKAELMKKIKDKEL